MILLDTNALLWLTGGDERLGPRARAVIESGVDESKAVFSAISIWETAMLVARGRYALGQPVESWRADLIDNGLREAPLEGLAAAMAASMTGLPADPADRMIAATSARLSAALVTSDRTLIAWARTRGGPAPVDARD